MIFRYDVCLEEYMDLSPTLINGTKSKHTGPMRRTKKSESKKKLNNKSHILFNTTQYKIGYNLAVTKDSRIFMYL